MNIRVKVGDKVFDVEVGSLASKPVVAVVDGVSYEVWPEENGGVARPKTADSAVDAMDGVAEPAPCADGGGIVTAPIPGVIINVAVKAGDTVKLGQELCMLEAMKMKNPIRATKEGKIASVMVNVGDHVKHGQTLLEYAS